MILDGFRTQPDFPFEGYFEDVAQYIQTRLYWLAVLRHAIGFDENDWQTDPDSGNPAEDMSNGLGVRLSSATLNKQIWIDTISLPGEINMVLRLNAPMDRAYLLDEFDEETRAKLLAGVPEDILRAETAAAYKPLMAWVEPAILWLPKPGHPEGGEEIAVERLIVSAEISEAAEPLALQALESFLAPGPAMDRVNRDFVRDD